jgi:non-specific serine/threonine protein kinase
MNDFLDQTLGKLDLAPPEALPPGTAVGPYVIVRFLGQGGFGITYEGLHRDLGRRVAIKEFFIKTAFRRDNDGHTVTVTRLSDGEALGRDLVDDILDRFVEEARKIATRFDHPGIVKGENFFRENKTAYLVMTYIEGRSYSAVLKSLGDSAVKLDERMLRATFDPVLDAVAYLHANDELHRDLKPDNIMIRNDGTPIIVDFGTSRTGMDRSSVTRLGFQSGGYSPPEQIAQDESVRLGPFTDIYSLAATLYRAVTGRTPAPSEWRLAMIGMGNVGKDPYVPAAAAVPKGSAFGPGFLSAIDKGLNLDPQKRPQTIMEFRRALGWLGPINDGMCRSRRRRCRRRPRHPLRRRRSGRVGG